MASPGPVLVNEQEHGILVTVNPNLTYLLGIAGFLSFLP